VISKSESKKSKKKEEDDITHTNKFLNQDLKELGPDRLNKEDIDELDIKKKVTKEFKTFKYFCQLIIDSEGKVVLPPEKVINLLTFG
jgi:hypothetical protein